MDMRTIENIKTAEEITRIIDETFPPSYMYYDDWCVIKGEWKEEMAVKDEVYRLLFQIQKINWRLYGDNVTPFEYVPNLRERKDLMIRRGELATEVKSLLEGKTQQNNDNKQPQQETDVQDFKIERKQELKDLLPEKLRLDAAVKVFQKAIDSHLIEHTTEGLIWKDTKQLLAYFAMKLSNGFHLSNKMDKDGRTTISWKPFETLFRETGLKDAKQNWTRLNTKFEPTGFEKVDTLL